MPTRRLHYWSREEFSLHGVNSGTDMRKVSAQRRHGHGLRDLREAGFLRATVASVKANPEFLNRPAQAGVQEWKTRISIWSRTAPTSDHEPAKEARSLAPYLCYGCHTSLTSRSSRGGLGSAPQMTLPQWTGGSLSRLERAEDQARDDNRLAMKREIEDFLVDDADEK